MTLREKFQEYISELDTVDVSNIIDDANIIDDIKLENKEASDDMAKSFVKGVECAFKVVLHTFEQLQSK